jgi:hypothetical protein
MYVQEMIHLQHLLVEDDGVKANLAADEVFWSVSTGMAVSGNITLSPQARAVRLLV